MTIEKVISGGQTGADIAGLKAAKACGIPTGGYMPKGFKTLEGPHPEYAEEYGCVEWHIYGYPQRTEMNVKESDFTFRFAGKWNTPGERLTLRMIEKYRKPNLEIDAQDLEVFIEDPVELSAKIFVVKSVLKTSKAKIVNIAGNSESSWPGIERLVYYFLVALFTEVNGNYDNGTI